MKSCVKLFVVCVLTANAIFGCGGTQKLNSRWLDNEIAIDGKQTDWPNRMTYIEKKRVAIGIANDEDYLYVTMTTSDRNLQRRIMVMGFALWVDPDGGKDREFGIRFPIGMREMGMMIRGRGEPPDMETMRANFEESLANLEIIMSGKEEPVLMQMSEATGITAMVIASEKEFVYEIKIPLYNDENRLYAIGVKDSKTLGIGFETVQFDRNKIREQMGNGGFDGERPPVNGRFGGRRPGDYSGRGSLRGGGGQTPEQLKLWVNVTLGKAGIAPSVEEQVEMSEVTSSR